MGKTEAIESVEIAAIKSSTKSEWTRVLEFRELNRKISEITLHNKKLLVEKIDLEKKIQSKEKVKKYIDTAFDITTYLIIGGEVVLGGIAISHGNYALGIPLIGMGAMQFATKILQDSGIIKKVAEKFIKKEDTREKVIKTTRGIITYVSITFSATTILINPSSAGAAFEEVKNIKKITEIALMSMKSVGATSKNIIFMQVTKYEGKITIVQGKIFLNNQHRQKVVSQQKEASDQNKRILDCMFQIFSITTQKE